MANSALIAPSGSRPTRVAVADDSLLIREAVSQLLGTTEGVDLVAVCGDGDSLWHAVETVQPDVVVTDVRMPPGGDDEGIRFASRARSTYPNVGVIVLTQYPELAYGAALLEGGAKGRAYVLKERISDRNELKSAIDVVAHGGTLIDPQIVDMILRHGGARDSDPVGLLTPRERQVLAEMAVGKSNSAIADGLTLTKHSVEKHIGSIFQKLDLVEEHDVSPRVAAVLLYLSREHGMP